MIKNNLLKTVSLPYKVVQGSFEHRQQKAEHYTQKIMQNLSQNFDKDGVSLSKLGRELKKILPKNLKVFIKKNNDIGAYAQLNRVFSKDNWVVSQSLELTPNKKGKLYKFDIPTITHEVRHLTDSLFHPKILSREQLIAKKGLDTDRFYDLYDNEIYITEMNVGKNFKKFILKNIKHKTERALKGYSTEDKINLLQNIRYNLISENNSFKDERKIAKKNA